MWFFLLYLKTGRFLTLRKILFLRFDLVNLYLGHEILKIILVNQRRRSMQHQTYMPVCLNKDLHHLYQLIIWAIACRQSFIADLVIFHLLASYKCQLLPFHQQDVVDYYQLIFRMFIVAMRLDGLQEVLYLKGNTITN